MNRQEKLTEAFRRLSQWQPTVAAAQVISVQARSCTVRFVADNIEVAGIRLQATERDNGNYCIVYPKVGTAVWVLLFSEERQGLLVALDEPDRWCYEKGDTTFEIGNNLTIHAGTGKVLVRNNTQSLQAVLTQMRDLLSKIASAVIPGMPGAPAGIQAIDPTISTGIAALNTNINALLKE